MNGTRRACGGPTIQPQCYRPSCSLAPPKSSCLFQLNYPRAWFWGPGGRLGVPGQRHQFHESPVSSCLFCQPAGEVQTKRILKIRHPTLSLHLPEVACPDMSPPGLSLSSTSLPPNMRSSAHSCLRMRVKQRTKAKTVEWGLPWKFYYRFGCYLPTQYPFPVLGNRTQILFRRQCD